MHRDEAGDTFAIKKMLKGPYTQAQALQSWSGTSPPKPYQETSIWVSRVRSADNKHDCRNCNRPGAQSSPSQLWPKASPIYLRPHPVSEVPLRNHVGTTVAMHLEMGSLLEDPAVIPQCMLT